MEYEIVDGKIIIKDKSEFNPEHILECGQVFRFGKDENGNYYVVSKDKKASIIENDYGYEIISKNPEYFVNYFDLNTNYTEIKNKLKQNEILAPMVDFGYGIRILKSDPEEMIYSYIISQNNHIKRIQKIIEKLSAIGDIIDDFHAFPTTEKLSNEDLSFFQTLGAGYRDKFLKETADFLKEKNIENLKKLPTDELFKFLLTLKGVGPKVASCILLFGFGRGEKFPVDTWIEQVYYNHFSNKKQTRPQIQKYFEDEFKENSGIAQQYLFFFERSKNKKS